jgi:hypothetical protein
MQVNIPVGITIVRLWIAHIDHASVLAAASFNDAADWRSCAGWGPHTQQDFNIAMRN